MGANSLASSSRSAAVPRPYEDPNGEARFEAMKRVLPKKKPAVIFIGDSITQGWEKRGPEVWKTEIEPLNAANLGVGGDKTENVLWRLKHGNVAGIDPAVVVLQIGVNNTPVNSAREIAAGIVEICKTLRRLLPRASIILESIPCERMPSYPLRKKLNEATELAARKLSSDPSVIFQPLQERFLAADGTLSPELMPDYFHPSEKGYRVWANAVVPKIRSILQGKSVNKP